MSANHDKVFVVTFLGVLGFLTALTIAIIAIANMITGDSLSDAADEIAAQRQAERIAPIGDVITDPAALKVAAKSAVETVRTAADIVGGLCAGCHTAGVAGAPKSDDTSAWKARLDAQGLAGLIQSVISGKGAMPAYAGDPSLSEDQIDASVKLMLDNAGVSY